MVKLTPRQTNLIPRLTPSLLTDHMTLHEFLKRHLSMKCQRWKHIIVEGRGEEGVRNCEDLKPIYKEGGTKNVFESHSYSQKTFAKCFLCGADHRPNWSGVVRII